MHSPGHIHSPTCECDFLHSHKFWCFQSSQWTSLSLVITFKILVRLLLAPSAIHCLRHDVKQLLLIISNKFSQGERLFALAELCVRLNKEDSFREPSGMSSNDVLPLPGAAGLLAWLCRYGLLVVKATMEPGSGNENRASKNATKPTALSFSHLFLTKCSPH